MLHFPPLNASKSWRCRCSLCLDKYLSHKIKLKNMLDSSLQLLQRLHHKFGDRLQKQNKKQNTETVNKSGRIKSIGWERRKKFENWKIYLYPCVCLCVCVTWESVKWQPKALKSRWALKQRASPATKHSQHSTRQFRWRQTSTWFTFKSRFESKSVLTGRFNTTDAKTALGVTFTKICAGVRKIYKTSKCHF